MSDAKPRWRAATETLGSAKLTVALMIVVAAASVLGTVVLQTSLPGADPAVLMEHYGNGAKTLILLGLTDVFHSTWYAVLLALLALCLAAGTVARFKWRLDRVGMLLAHAGALAILAGGLVYNLLGDKGVVTIAEGDTADKYLSRRDGRYHPLPFALRLDRFVAERYPARMVLVGPKGESLAVVPKEGEVVTPPWTSARVKFLRVMAQAERVVEVRDDAAGPRSDAARFRIETAEGTTEFWRFAVRASPADTLLRVNGRIAVAYDNETTWPANDVPDEPRAYAINRATGRTVETPCREGETFPIPNADAPAEGEVVAVIDDADNSSLGPVLRLRVTADNVTGWRHAIAKMPTFSLDAAAALTVVLPEIDFVYYRPTLSMQVTRSDDTAEGGALAARFSLQWWPKPVRGESTPGSAVMAVGTPVDVGGAKLTLLDALERARVDARYEPSAGRTGVEAALVRVEWPDGTPREYWLATAGADRGVRPAEALALAYAAQEDVREFRGDVTLDDRDRATVRVNAPVARRGWQIFLEAGDPDALPPIARLVLSRDPGLSVVYAGLVLLVIGAFWSGLVKPREEST